MEELNNPKNSEAERSEARDERSSANFLEELKKASQEIEGTEGIQPKVSEIPKETPIEVSEKIGQDLENHLSEIVKERKRLEEDRKKIQERLSKVLNLENRIRRFLDERKKINEELGKYKEKS